MFFNNDQSPQIVVNGTFAMLEGGGDRQEQAGVEKEKALMQFLEWLLRSFAQTIQRKIRHFE